MGRAAIYNTLTQTRPDTPCLVELSRALCEKHGSLLRGWRNVLDIDGDLRCKFSECCAGLGNVQFKGDVVDLFRLYEGQSSLALKDVDPLLAKEIKEMRRWVKGKFGGPFEMFDAFDDSGDGQISFSEFKEATEKFGLQKSESVIQELFEGLDLQGNGLISREAVIVLEDDEEERHALFADLANKDEEEKQAMMAELYKTLSTAHLKPRHRLSDRPWHADINDLPQVVLDRRRKWERRVAKEKFEALEAFRHHLRSTYGHELRAWRRELDPDASYTLTRAQLTQYCVRVCFKANPSALWLAINRDLDGSITIDEWVPKHAKVLADFRAWVRRKRGTKCVRLPGFHAADVHQDFKFPGFRSKKVHVEDFKDSVVNLGYDADEEVLDLLVTSLDFHGCGFIRTEDLLWLDDWQPPTWLVSAPDPQALHDLQILFIKHYGNFIQAWRRLIDIDRSNRVSWNEFRAAADYLGFTGNVAGAWRILDSDFSGYIGLSEFDFAGYEHLASFKKWADQTFGSVIRAFHFLDKDKSGGLTFAEMKKACKQLSWDGNPRILFELLDTGNKKGEPSRYITLDEIEFLDSIIEVHYQQPIQMARRITVCHTTTAFDCTRTPFELEVMLALREGQADADSLFRHPKRPASAGSLSKRPASAGSLHSRATAVSVGARHSQHQRRKQPTLARRGCRTSQLHRTSSNPEFHLRESVSCNFGKEALKTWGVALSQCIQYTKYNQ